MWARRSSGLTRAPPRTPPRATSASGTVARSVRQQAGAPSLGCRFPDRMTELQRTLRLVDGLARSWGSWWALKGTHADMANFRAPPCGSHLLGGPVPDTPAPSTPPAEIEAWGGAIEKY